MLFSAGSSQQLHISEYFLCFLVKTKLLKNVWKLYIFPWNISARNWKKKFSELSEKDSKCMFTYASYKVVLQ